MTKSRKSSKGWIQRAVKKPGSFTLQAHRAGYKNVQAYAEWVLNPKNAHKTTKRTKSRARLARLFKRFSRKTHRRSKK